MHKCSNSNCQFQSFLHNECEEEIVFFKDNENADTYCIFHAPEKIKKNFRTSQTSLFSMLLARYIMDSQNQFYLDFSEVVFINHNFLLNDLNLFEKTENVIIDFSNAIFINNIRFDNIKCKKLIFRDTKFLDGGGIKNREKDKNLQIQSLIFKPYRVDSDFVIDIGQYINRDTSLIELKQGIIEEIQFENHKIGDGYIFFIGLNKDTEAHFENMLLDKVYFQNCDLSNCYFLNAKIATTEFRNCEFPWNENLKIINILKSKESRWEFVIAPIFFLLIPIIFNILPDTTSDVFLQWLGLSLYLIMVFYIIITLVSLDIWIELLSFYIAKLPFGKIIKRENLVNKLYHKSAINKHIAIADEVKIYKKLEMIKYEDTMTIMQIQKTLTSLRATYEQLQINFKEKDFQTSGDFFYSKRYTELISIFGKSITEFFVLSLHHLTNGFGERFVKPFIWLFMTFFIFTVIFTFILKPNQHYIATPNTPLYLVTGSKLLTDEEKPSSYRLDAAKSFMNYLDINQTDNTKIDNTKVLVGFNKKGDYSIASQKILQLKDSIFIGSLKSLSNIAYPFSINTKKWFQDITKEAFTANILETVFLWYFAGAFMLALWRRIKR